jgi:hypothetical protein
MGLEWMLNNQGCEGGKGLNNQGRERGGMEFRDLDFCGGLSGAAEAEQAGEEERQGEE